MRRLRLALLLDTLPERLALAARQNPSHLEFLEQLFSDEVTGRDADSAGLRTRAAHLDPTIAVDLRPVRGSVFPASTKPARVAHPPATGDVWLHDVGAVQTHGVARRW